MKVVDGLAALIATVDHEAVAVVGEAFGDGEFLGEDHEASDEFGVGRLERRKAGDVSTGNDQDVDRSLGGLCRGMP